MTVMTDSGDSVGKAEPTDRDETSNERDQSDNPKTTPQKQ